ncbi:hypothetical protein KM043_000052, partial [Ampulex compressa]
MHMPRFAKIFDSSRYRPFQPPLRAASRRLDKTALSRRFNLRHPFIKVWRDTETDWAAKFFRTIGPQESHEWRHGRDIGRSSNGSKRWSNPCPYPRPIDARTLDTETIRDNRAKLLEVPRTVCAREFSSATRPPTSPDGALTAARFTLVSLTVFPDRPSPVRSVRRMGARTARSAMPRPP